MLSQELSERIKQKLITKKIKKKELALIIGKSYNNTVNVINRKISNKNIELLLENWVNNSILEVKHDYRFAVCICPHCGKYGALSKPKLAKFCIECGGEIRWI